MEKKYLENRESANSHINSITIKLSCNISILLYKIFTILKICIKLSKLLMEMEENQENNDGSEPKDFLTTLLGNTIKKRRIDLGYSMEKVSQISNVSRGMLGLIESGRTTPSVGILWKLSRALRISIGEMIPDLFLKNPKLLKWEDSKLIEFNAGNLKIRILHNDNFGKIELYDIEIQPGNFPIPSILENSFEQNIIVIQGNLELIFQDKNFILSKGDSVVCFTSDLKQIKVEKENFAKLIWIAPNSIS
jgi:transcriptional regulator with XRE-family HTH domain